MSPYPGGMYIRARAIDSKLVYVLFRAHQMSVCNPIRKQTVFYDAWTRIESDARDEPFDEGQLLVVATR
jgi:hypothetical protein